jgi:2-keto-3-deoxy-L-rhamnonate aldolase RhmA
MKLSWQQIPSTIISDILCQNSLDGVVIDLEHGSFNIETVYACIQVVTLNGKKCFVRLPSIDISMIRYCLDAGCTGLIFSTIESASDAKLVKKFSKYPKYGGLRGLGLVRENAWGKKDLVSEPPTLICQIETIKGVSNIESIWSENVFDYCMIGPYDLSASIGTAGDFESNEYKKSVEKVSNYVSKEMMAVHIPNDVHNQLKKYEGFGIIALGMDTTFIVEKYKEIENA